MPLTFVRLAAAALGIVFAWAAVAKPLRWPHWREALRGYGWSPPAERAAAFAVPLAEAVAAVCLLAGPQQAGAAVALALLAGSSLVVARLRARNGNQVPCGCFGKTAARDARLVLVRNALLGVLAAVVLVASGRATTSLSAPDGAALLPAALALAGLALGAWTLWRAGGAMRGKPRA